MTIIGIVKIWFWLTLVGVALRFAIISIGEYPRKVKYEIWEDVLSVIGGICLAIYLAIKVWR